VDQSTCIRRKLANTLLIAAPCVMSHGTWAATGWTDAGTVSQLNQQPGAGAGADQFFVTIAVTTNPSGCSLGNGFYMSIGTDKKKAFVRHAHGGVLERPGGSGLGDGNLSPVGVRRDRWACDSVVAIDAGEDE
jgi:hypothetical protein